MSEQQDSSNPAVETGQEQAAAPPDPPAEVNQPASRHIGRKIWYGFIIFLSGLVILICVAGTIGTWVAEAALSDTAVRLLGVVDTSAGGIRQAAGKVDGMLGEVQQITLGVAQAAGDLSQNINDQGLVLLLLPEEQEQKLTALSEQIRDTFTTVKELMEAGLALYNTIDSIPFVSLPAPDPEQVEAIQQTLDDVRSDVDNARTAIEEFRSTTAGKVDNITDTVVSLSVRLQEGRDSLAALDAQLANVQQQARTWQQVIPTLLVVAAVLLTLFLVYVGYTQVEVIRLFVKRWKGL